MSPDLDPALVEKAAVNACRITDRYIDSTGVPCAACTSRARAVLAAVLPDVCTQAIRDAAGDEAAMAEAWGRGAAWYTTGNNVAAVVASWLYDRADRIAREAGGRDE